MVGEFIIHGKKIVSYDTYWGELAWRIIDVPYVFEYAYNNNYVILGGDILSNHREHNYDSWYYNRDKNKDYNTLIQESFEKANQYISSYIKNNGVDFFVVVVMCKPDKVFP